MKIYDNHTHLNDKPFAGKEADYIQKARDLDVVGMNCVGQDPEMNLGALELAKRFANVKAIIGYCPDVAKDYDQAAEDLLVEQVKGGQVVAIGEIGLDYYWDESPRDVQRKVFARQIEVARDLQLPVNIHTRDAFADCWQILKEADLEYGAVLHSYNGGPEWTEKFLDLNVNFSFSGVVSFKKAAEVHESAKMVPLDRLLVETDAPFLTPVPYRGRQNEPGYVRYVAQAVADLKGLDLAEVAEATYANTMRIYGLNAEEF
ncbi:TatD family hydrolase [Lactobacillus delbrueckii]|uniref:TatD family hydrolase n=1 Tax=Lactobacillus delbrueckii TaxID=1584 RepID=UPI001F45C787|nr:TatD family hydrolase [Lactobacillus delbrueckii]GHN23501.1 TatD family hydrolase [Lactobacillus delbrueckii]GHN25294.1 TatD family hydrolase [Lactobacillus delbrueckii]GHN27804.1 TatD family hydrolase [Lactobacillus delbrueckii]